MNFESLFVNPSGRTSRSHFVPALIVLLAVFAFYTFLVRGRTAQWCMVVLLFPAVVLHARRLHDLGYSAWLLIVPATLMLLNLTLRLKLFSVGAPLQSLLPVIALTVCAAFALWGCIGKGAAEANRFGAPLAA